MKHGYIFAVILLVDRLIFGFSSLDFLPNYIGSGLESGMNYPEILARGNPVFFYSKNNSELALHTMFRNDTIALRNTFFLNNQNSELTFDYSTIDIDRQFALRRILNISLDYKYKESPDKSLFLFYCTMRNKSAAGFDQCSLTVDNSSLVSSGLPLYGDHDHDYPLNVIWARELWIGIELENLVQIPFGNQHRFKMGIFPFSLGRGIVLGDAYSIDFFGRSGLGFDPSASIDQFAPGCLLSGYLIDKRLSYDLYLGFLRALDNPPSSLAINKAVMNQSQYHYVDSRFFNVRDKGLAFRLIYKTRKDLAKHAVFEPYLFVDIPRNQIQDYIVKAKGNLVCVGCAGECYLNNFDFGFDSAFNFFHIKYLPQDNNVVEINNLEGIEVAQNTEVIDTKIAPDFLALASCSNQKDIKSVPLEISNNSKPIPNSDLVNSKIRFRDEILATGKGAMFVYDMAYSFFDSRVRAKFSVGYASGGEYPLDPYYVRNNKAYKNKEVAFRYTNEFIPIQDLYNGKRIKSGFLMAGGGSQVIRFRSFPNPNLPVPYPDQEFGFTDLVHVGLGVDFKSADLGATPKYILNPNLLWFWQDKSIKLPPFYLPGNGKEYADKYFGLEANIFLRWNFVSGLEFFALGAWFFPGQYYKDIEGYATNPAQAVYYDNLSKGVTDQLIVPTNGASIGWVFNTGLIYNF